MTPAKSPPRPTSSSGRYGGRAVCDGGSRAIPGAGLIVAGIWVLRWSCGQPRDGPGMIVERWTGCQARDERLRGTLLGGVVECYLAHPDAGDVFRFVIERCGVESAETSP